MFYFILLLTATNAQDPKSCAFEKGRDEFSGGTFPEDFIWSLATASYQIEGSWEKDGKGENIWDRYSHTNNTETDQCNVDECHTGDVACDSYDQTARDIQQLVELGIKHYRFSLSWSRIIPLGSLSDDSQINQAGLDHYSKFIDDLLAAGITPIVTLYHWDLPQALQDKYEGWLGDQIVEDFGNYARVCFEHLGDRAKFWITINEPMVVADLGYGWGVMAPGIKKKNLIARYNTVRAHARAYHIFKTEFKEKQNGRCGITLNCDWYEPKTDSMADIDAAQQKLDFQLGFWADPIFKTGDYPEGVKNIYGDDLPQFTEEEKELNLHSADGFFGLNHYTARILESCEDYVPGCDHGILETTCSNWLTSGSTWLWSVPWGFHHLLKYIHNRYDSEKYPIYITENGISSKNNGTDAKPELNDQWRVNHYHGYIGQMHRAMAEGVVVKAYTAWSLMDNFEWSRGYTERFGLIWVNFTDPDRSVSWKDSAKYYKGVAAGNSVEGNSVEPEPEPEAEPEGSGSNTITLSIALFLIIQLF